MWYIYILECIDSIRYAPMAGGNFTLKVILVDEKEKIIKLAEASQQEFIKSAPYILVVCSDNSRTINAYGEKGESFCKQQAGSAIQNFLLKITEKRLATCWIGYFVEEQVKRILKIPEKINIEAMFPIGYELGKPEKRRVKANLDKALYFNEYEKVQMKKIPKIEGRRIGKFRNKK